MEPVLLTQFSAAAGSALVAAIWQGLLLAAAVALCLRLLPGITAAARAVVWLAVMLLIVALPFVHFGAAGAATGTPFHIDARVSLALAAIWAACSLFRAAELVRSAIYLLRLSRQAQPVTLQPSLVVLLRAGSRHAVLCRSLEVDRPSVVGFFSPRILVPASLLDRLSAAELEQIVLHEMEHIRRGDDWTNLLQKLSLVLFPLNPVLVWIERRLCLERELACDDRVLRATGARKAYAACLANLAEQALVRRGVSLALGAWERRPELVRRVHRILAENGRPMAPRQLAAVVTLLLAGVVAGSDALAHSPQLVSFGPAMAQPSDLAALQPIFPGRDTGHAAIVPVEAIMPPANAPTMTRRVQAIQRRTPVRTQLRPQLRAQLRPQMAQRVALTARDVNAGQPLVVMVTWRVVSTDAASAQASQFAYAAVPTRNGWLFVQL
jgi:beta-lactamase regulating signal transducer with metallopeptidase domain